ncbi:MAG TPA: PKD domain-containing protein [Candidatus Paceibacterota bacterium]|nr:PKD domain-containing protein [Verrucomicrobiota bacterium]HRZ46412.1 PKD domain-containing protein [Candidatus Paceibacterota bacterium]
MIRWGLLAACVLCAAAASAAALPDLPPMALGARARGVAAIHLLGNHLPSVAAAHGKSPAELRGIFLRDQTLWIEPDGRLLYVCETEPLPADPASTSPDEAAAFSLLPADQTFFLHSRPGATKVIHLDFDGHTTSGTAWNSRVGGGDIVTPPYDIDGDRTTFSAAELTNIQYIWQRIAEDYAPYDVDVTTEDPGVEGLSKTSSSDPSYGIRVCIGGSSLDWYGASAGGVAYVGSFNWSSDTPCFAFPAQLGNGNEKYTAEAASHEAGHTLGLHHDGTTDGTVYYAGHGSWAPIMGVGYYKTITQWSKGEYPLANNKEDDLAVMQNYGIAYRADDHLSTIASATFLPGPSIFALGLIERNTDLDVFSFQTGAGAIQFTATPGSRGPNLDIRLGLYDGSGYLVAANDLTTLDATLSATVAAGTYHLSVEGVGAGDLATGYSDYASLGQYTLTGTIVPIGTLQPPVASAFATPTAGAAPLTVAFSSAGSDDPDGAIARFEWSFGDGASSLEPNPTHVYSAAGSYQAVLIVTDNSGLSANASVIITVQDTLTSNNIAFVGQIQMSLLKSVAGSTAQARVLVFGATTMPVPLPNAIVTGVWSGLTTGTATATTDADGEVVFTSKKSKKVGTFTFTVTRVSAIGYTYDPNQNDVTTASIANQ